MTLVWAFFRRDAAIALSYRPAFALQFLGNLVLLGLLYYVGRTVGPRGIPALEPYGGDFLAFAMIGVALTDCVVVSLLGFAQQVREAQTTGTLEATLMSPVPLSAVLVCSSLWSYFLSGVRFLFYLAVGAAVFGVNLGHGNVPAALLIFLLTVVCFMGVGILWAGVVLLIKRGEAVTNAIGYVVFMLAGVLFPVSLLPGWMRFLSDLIPLTCALEAMRLALLKGAGVAELGPALVRLGIFAGVLIVAGIAGFNAAVRVAKRTGSLTQY